jgi:hypothetical protein
MTTSLTLHYGKSTKPVMHIVPDEKYPGMWRIMAPDGTMSDMVNITRAKDAAKAIAARKLSTPTNKISTLDLRWMPIEDPRQERQEINSVAAPMRYSGDPLTLRARVGLC